MFSDYHLHTSFSNDSNYPMEDLVQHALRLNLEELCFTEHIDYDVPGCLLDYTAYIIEYNRLKMKYTGQISLKLGAEFGVQKHTLQTYTIDFNKYNFDFIILSNHQVDNLQFWNGEFQKGKTQEAYNNAYYAAIYDVITQFKDYSVLGHLDMIKRYDNYGIYPDEKLKDVLTKILTQVIADNKGIEVNTSYFAYGLPDLTPSTYILELYRDLGGTIITIGSDTHQAEQLGKKIPEVQTRLKQLGYKTFCTFEKMNPIYHEL